MKNKILKFFKNIFLYVKKRFTIFLPIISFVLGTVITIIFLSHFYGIGENGKYNKIKSKVWFLQLNLCLGKNELLNKKQEYLINAMTETEQNINSANKNIENARKTAWESYDEMGNALENLDNIDFVEIYNIY